MAVLAVDQGTSGTKAVVVDADGTVLALAEVPVTPTYLGDGRVEQDPLQLLDSVLEAGRRAVAEAGVRIDAVGLANQGETVLAWDDADGTPLSTALVWQDRRAAELCATMAADGEWIADRTGLELDPYFSAPKMAWLRRSGVTGGVVTTTDTWLIHRLTGAFVGDVTTASRSLLMDLDTVAWDPELLAVFGLADERMPRLVACDEVVGMTSAFGGDVPVGGLVVDQQAALLAEGCLTPGTAKCTYGTGAFCLANTGDQAVRSGNGLSSSVAWRIRGDLVYCLDGQVYTVASAVRWLVDLGLLDDARGLDAACGEDGRGVAFVPALAGLAAPWWRADARGAFLGLGLDADRGALVRAVVDGVAAQVAALVEAVEADLGRPLDRLRVDGGLTQSTVLMQAQADLLQRPVEVYASPHATALGTAAAAHLAADPTLTLDDVNWPWTPAATYEPQWSADRAAEFRGRWLGAVEVVLADAEGQR